MAKQSEKSKTKKLDKLWSEAVKRDAKSICQICGSTEYVNAHHIFGRRNFSVRWDLENGICLCAKHHTFDKWSAHQAPMWFSELLIDRFGRKWYERLERRAKSVSKPNKDELLEYFKNLERK